jgi:hypothetical protein
MSGFHQISDLENHKLNNILDVFSNECVLGSYNDHYVYIHEGRKVFRLARHQISPEIDAKTASRQITYFGCRKGV